MLWLLEIPTLNYNELEPEHKSTCWIESQWDKRVRWSAGLWAGTGCEQELLVGPAVTVMSAYVNV